jgi:hypothetical protein
MSGQPAATEWQSPMTRGSQIRTTVRLWFLQLTAAALGTAAGLAGVAALVWLVTVLAR